MLSMGRVGIYVNRTKSRFNQARKRSKQSGSGRGGGEKVDGWSKPINAEKLELVKELHELLKKMYALVDLKKKYERGTFECAVKTGNVDSPSAPFGEATRAKKRLSS